MSLTPKPSSKPFLIHSIQDLERAFSFARVANVKPNLVVDVRHLNFWGHQNFAHMIKIAANRNCIPTPQEYIDYTLTIHTSDHKAHALCALLSPLAKFTITTQQPVAPSLALLAKQRNVTLLS